MRVVAVLAFCWAGPAASASAAALRLVARGAVTGYGARGDGGHFVASELPGGDVEVLDVRSRRRRWLSSPPGCNLQDMHRGVVLWSCYRVNDEVSQSGATYDLRTGRLRTLQAFDAQGSSFAYYAAVGHRWARIRLVGPGEQVDVYRNRLTGELASPSGGADYVDDLDAPMPMRRLCDGQRRQSYVLEDAVEEPGTAFAPLTVSGTWAATTAPRTTESGTVRVLLQRCGAPRRVLRVCRVVKCSQPVIADGQVAWTEALGGRTRLVARSLRTGRERSLALSSPFDPVLGLNGHLYVTIRRRLFEVD